jgi:hypothetical protein
MRASFKTGDRKIVFHMGPGTGGMAPRMSRTQAFSSVRRAGKRNCASSNRAYALLFRTYSAGALELGVRTDLHPPSHAHSGLSHDGKGAGKICPVTSEDLGGKSSLPLLGLAGQTQEHYSGVLLPSAVHQLTEVFVPSDKDR